MQMKAFIVAFGKSVLRQGMFPKELSNAQLLKLSQNTTMGTRYKQT